jgi:hypothetical protein
MQPIKAGTSTMHGALFPIITVTGTGSAPALGFTNIPQTFQHLMFVAEAPNNGGGSGGVAYFTIDNVNANSTTIYSYTAFGGNGATITNTRATNTNSFLLNPALTYVTSTAPASVVVHILDYTNTSTFKTFHCRLSLDKNGSGETAFLMGTFRNTGAITRFNISSAVVGSNWTTGAIFTLYGVRSVGQ